MNNNYHVLLQIEQSLQDIRNAVEANTANIDILEEAIATLTLIPARKINLTYEHKENKLWVNDRFYIKFEEYKKSQKSLQNKRLNIEQVEDDYYGTVSHLLELAKDAPALFSKANNEQKAIDDQYSTFELTARW